MNNKIITESDRKKLLEEIKKRRKNNQTREDYLPYDDINFKDELFDDFEYETIRLGIFARPIKERDDFFKVLDGTLKYVSSNKNKKTFPNEKFDELINSFKKYFVALYGIEKEHYNAKPKQLAEAMDYALLGNGKRLRAMLMCLTFYLFDGKDIEILENFMLAIEMIHAFSLVHDDLPAIDNDELRRGKMSTWKKYGEAIGILAGDALLIEGFHVIHRLFDAISEYEEKINYANQDLSKDILYDYDFMLNIMNLRYKVEISLYYLSHYTGNNGMIAGETMDVLASGKKISKNKMKEIYGLKTGALFFYSILTGYKMAKGEDDEFVENDEYVQICASIFGFIYQVVDDVLDVEGNEKDIGKPKNSDKKNGKWTVVDEMGIDGAKKEIKQGLNNLVYGISKFNGLDENKKLLYTNFMKYVIERKK